MIYNQDTISCIVTAPINSGVWIIRISGAKSYEIGCTITKTVLQIRYAHYLSIFDKNNSTIDKGIILYFKSPN